jgi:pyruvate kinase
MSDAIKQRQFVLWQIVVILSNICLETISTYFSIYIKQKNPYATKFVMGVKSYYYDKIVSTDDTVTDEWNKREKGYVTKGDFLINLAAMPIKEKRMVNTMRVSEIE